MSRGDDKGKAVKTVKTAKATKASKSPKSPEAAKAVKSSKARKAPKAAKPAKATTDTLLITAFEPFDGAAINPSWEVARALHQQRIGSAQVVAVQLPCVFASALPALQAALDAHQPRWVISLGLAGSRAAISLERVALNLIDARIADNAGVQLTDEPVLPGGPAAHFTGLPVKALLQRLQQAGHRAELSYSAGTFVCNQVFYGLMQALASRAGVVGGFIHVPPLPGPEVPAGQAMALQDQAAAIHAVAGALVAGVTEVHAVGGRVD